MQQTKRLASVLALTVFLITLVGSAGFGAQPKLSQLRRQYSETTRSMDYVKGRLRNTKIQQKDMANQLAVSEKRLETSRRTLRDIQVQLRNTRDKLSATQAELEKIEKRLQERNDLLAARLVDTYKHGSVSYVSVVLGAADFWDLLSRTYMIKKVLQSDVDLIDAIEEDKQAVEEYKAILDEQERKRAELEQQQATMTRAVYSQTAQREHLLGQITNQRAGLEQMLAREQAESRQLEGFIRQLEAQARKKSGGKPTPVWRGGFICPVNGGVTSGYGMRIHPILRTRRMHTGVDLRASSGTPIKAAAGGEVLFAGHYGSAYGNTVILSHGNGVTTLYGHCSSVSVRTGQKVSQGQVIARVGSTGWSTGPHLHFEKRVNGRPVSPF